MKKFWQITNLTDTEAEVRFYGQIASERPWWDKEKRLLNLVCPAEFIDDMSRLSSKSLITIRVNSPGGDVFAALAIANYLKGMSTKKRGIVDGVAASSATIILSAMDSVESPVNALWMFHNPKVLPDDYMDADGLLALAEDLKTVKDSILDAYMAKAIASREEMSALMDQEKWIKGREVKDLGIVDKLLYDSVTVSASAQNCKCLFVNNVEMDFSAFKEKPEINKTEVEENNVDFSNVTDLEKAYPALVAQIKNDAVSGERTRIQKIEAISRNMKPEMVSEAKFTTPIDAAQLAVKALEDNAALGAAYVGAAKADFQASGAGAVGGAPGDPPPVKDDAHGSIFKNIAARFDRSIQREEE